MKKLIIASVLAVSAFGAHASEKMLFCKVSIVDLKNPSNPVLIKTDDTQDAIVFDSGRKFLVSYGGNEIESPVLQKKSKGLAGVSGGIVFTKANGKYGMADPKNMGEVVFLTDCEEGDGV